MYLSEICIKRPVLATVLNLIIVIIGIVAFFKLPLRGTPDIDMPVITIESAYIGANASFMESNITKPLEQAIKNIKNLDHISSTSSTNFSSIEVVLKMSADIEIALNDIRSKVSEVAYKLPNDMPTPAISKMSANNQPSIWITTTSTNYDPMVLTDIITQRVKPELEKLDTVSNAKIYSASNFAIQISIDPVKLFQNKLTPLEIHEQIKTQTKNYPAGFIKTDIKDYVLNLKGELSSVEEFSNIIIRNVDGNLLKLKDVAKIELKPEEYLAVTRYNGSNTITLGVTKRSKANIIELSNEVMEALPKIEKSLPVGIKLHIAYDDSVHVKASINSVYLTAFEALILVLLIVYLFLGNAQVTIIPFVAIPVSIIGTFAFMQAAGFTINLYSLLAMIMAIGLVVDDAIVMLENVYRHFEKGKTAFESAILASKEIGFAILTMTTTLTAVFLPIGFIEGFVGKLFIEFAWTLAFCVIISGFVALTLSPMLASKILGSSWTIKTPQIVLKFGDKVNELTEIYIEYLLLALNNYKKIALIALSSVLVLIISFYFATKEFMPTEDYSFIIVSGKGADGATLTTSVSAIKQAEDIIKTVPEVKGYFFNISQGNQAYGFVPLQKWSDRSKSQQEIVNILNTKLSQIPAMTIFAMNPGGMSSGDSHPIMLDLLSFGNFKELDEISQKFLNELKENKIFENPDRDLRTSIPTIEIAVDRDVAAMHHVYLNQIGTTLQYLIAGVKVSDFSVGNEKYEVMLRFDKEDRNKISDLSKIYVKDQNGKMIHLSNLAKIEESISVQSYNHYNTAKSVQLTSELRKGNSINDAKDAIDKIAAKLIPHTNIKLEFFGDIKRMQESNSSMLFTFLLALVFIYLVLSAQFESFTDPLIILLAVPFSITGGVLAIVIGGSSINLYSNIGIVTLVGLITKNSIMIVEFANQLRTEGKSKLDSIVTSCRLRLRPILMTTSATIFGAIPLVLASGAAAESRSSIGLVIAGGMLIGTLFTVFVIPLIYYKFKK